MRAVGPETRYVKFSCRPDPSATVVSSIGASGVHVGVGVFPFLSTIVASLPIELNVSFDPSLNRNVNVVDLVRFASIPGGATHPPLDSRNVWTPPVGSYQFAIPVVASTIRVSYV